MTPNAVCIGIDPERAAHILRHEVAAKLQGGGSDVTLDFSAVPRIDTETIGALEEVASAAAGKPARVILRGVNRDIYKALKLLRLTERFSFES